MVARKKFKRASAAIDIDLDDAAKFLRWLDRGAEAFSFQTWDDRGNDDKRLVRLLHGSLGDHGDELAEVNRRGAAVGVTMNLTDLKGTRRENIVRVRALLLDLDDESKAEGALEQVRACRLRPHRVVETSPGRYHVYWLIDEGDGVVLNEFEDIQRAIAKRFDGDPQVAMLTHRARLPGFFHNKREPHLVHTLSSFAHAAFDWDAVCAEFPGEAKPHRAAGSLRTDALILIDGAPVKNAETFVEQRYQRDEQPLLRCYQNTFYGWTGSHWCEMRDDMLEHELYGFLDAAVVMKKKGAMSPFNPTRGKVVEIVHALRRALIIDHRLQPPVWLGPEGRTAENLVACRNGILNLRTRKLLPHDPGFFTTICLPLDYDPAAPEPKRWLQFLEELWPTDEEAEETLKEICGYLLTADTSQQKAFLIVGPKRGGKGTIIHVITTLLGADNVVSVTLDSLAGEFGKWPLIDKLLAVVADARLGGRPTHRVAEHLLSISGGDMQTINRKLQSFWTGYLPVRFVISTNEIPEIADASGTLPSRFIVLQLKESFYGREDTKLKAKLAPELAGILNWALDGLDQLNERGYFVMPKSSRAPVREMEDLSSPIKAFLREWGEVNNDASVLVRDFYASYRAWAGDAGHKISPKNVFGKTLRALAPKLRTSSSGSGRRRYVGVGLSERGREMWDECRDERKR